MIISFHGENFRGMLKPIIGGYSTPKFRGETFAGAFITTKFVKVFSLESFPLYGIIPSNGSSGLSGAPAELLTHSPPSLLPL